MCEMMNNDLRRLEQLFERGFGFGRAEVALSDLLVELTGDPAADRRVTSIGMTQAARTEAAQMFTEFQQNHAFTHAIGLDRRDHTAARAPVNANVGLENPRFDFLRRIVVTQTRDGRIGKRYLLCFSESAPQR